MSQLLKHLQSRHVNPNLYTFYCDDDAQVVTFYCYDVARRHNGTLQYRPNVPKTRRNDEKYGRYYSVPTSTTQIYFGGESLCMRPDLLVLVEGMFDAVRFHNAGVPALAVMANDPKRLVSLFTILRATRRLIGVRDNDVAGMKLAGCVDECYTTDTKDVGEMSSVEFEDFLKTLEV
jgi:hypothetical protein